MKILSRLLRSAVMALCLVASLGWAQQAVDLKPGDKAPDFTLRGSDGQEYSLAQFLGKKAVALCWFPRAGSGGAKTQCAALQAAMASLPTDKVQVFGCSTQPLDVTITFGQQGQYSFPVLADADRSVAQAYGCLRPDGLSLRYTYLINDQGLIVAVNKDITPATQGADLARMLVAAGLMPGATPPAAPTTGDQQINTPVGAVTRTCFVHVPPSYDGAKPMPLVIALHGARGNGRGMAGATGFNALADQYGFIAAYPDGIAGDRTWNALFGKIPGGEGVLADDVDDVAFLRGLIEQLHASHHADPERVFVCGHSAGAYMAYRAAVELSDIIAAAGIVNGSLGIKSLDGKPCGATIPQPVAPVSLIHICGWQDGVVKFSGAQTPKNLFKSVLDCVAFFVAAEGCATPGATTDDPATQVSRTLYTGGKNGTEVKLVIVQRGNHGWPTPAVGLSATQELWDFFAAHPKQAAAGNAGGAQ